MIITKNGQTITDGTPAEMMSDLTVAFLTVVADVALETEIGMVDVVNMILNGMDEAFDKMERGEKKE